MICVLKVQYVRILGYFFKAAKVHWLLQSMILVTTCFICRLFKILFCMNWVSQIYPTPCLNKMFFIWVVQGNWRSLFTMYTLRRMLLICPCTRCIQFFTVDLKPTINSCCLPSSHLAAILEVVFFNSQDLFT